MAARKKYKFEDEPLEVVPVELSREQWEEKWARQHFKNRVVHQLIEKLSILPDMPTCDAVIDRAEYICKKVYDVK